MKNSKTEWLDIFDDSEESKESKISLKYDQIKGVVIYKSLRDSIVPKSRMVLPYEFVDEDKELKTCKNFIKYLYSIRGWLESWEQLL